jgi:ribosomal protein S12 methylthiotransferase accessory factor YcaO
MDADFSAMRHALDAACASGIISKAHLLPLPAALPFRAAVSSAALPNGCAAPPGPIPLRVGSGIGPTAEAAAFLAMTEAAERYALQYDPSRPQILDPFIVAGGAADPAPLAALTLGAPGGGEADSRGGAAGVSLADAAVRALYELLERHHVREDGTLVVPFRALAVDAVPALARHTAYLADQLRVLDIAVMVSPFGYSVARTLCCDADGGRPTMGSAAGAHVEGTVRRAAEEAILLWRNMVEMEARSAPVPPPGTHHGDLVRVYRGAAPIARGVSGEPLSMLPAVPAPDAPLAQIVHATTGRRVRVFDLTAPTLDVAVARAVLD